MDRSPLDQFWKLSENKDGTRVEAAVKILLHLNSNKAGVVTNGLDNENEEGKEESVVDYVLKRLIRGLGSEREAARQGFFVCLVELLRNKSVSNDISVQKVMEVMDSNLTVSGSKAEEGSLAQGKVAAFGALIRSGKVDANSPDVGDVFSKMIEVSKKRNYLVPLANHFIVDFIQNGSVNEEAFKTRVWPVLCQSFAWSGPDASLSSLWVLLEVHAKFPAIISKSFVQETFDRKKFLDENFAQDVCNLAVRGNIPVHALHGGPVLKRVIQTFGTAGKNGDLLLTFWTKFAAPNITKSSCFKTSVGFVILDLILANLTDLKMAPKFLTANVVGVIHHLFTKMMLKADDKALIMCVLERVANIAKEEPETQMAFVKALMSCSVAYDKVTGAGTIQKILTVGNLEVVKCASDLYREAVVGHGGEHANHIYTSQERIYSAQQLSKLVSHPSTQKEVTWKADILCFLMATTLFSLKRPFGSSISKAPLGFSKDFQKVTKDVFFKALDVKAKSFEAMCQVLYETLKFACQLKADTSAGSWVAGPLSGNAVTEWNKMVKAVEKIQGQAVVSKEDRVFQVLFIHVGFQLLGSSSDTSTVESLQDLHVCYSKSKEVKSTSSKKKTGSKKNPADEQEEPKWVEVVVDLLLSLLSQDKHSLRQVASSVTSLLCPHMTTDALNSVLEVIGDEQDDAKNDDDVDEDEEENEEGDEEDAGDESNEEEEEEDDKEQDKNSDDESEDEDVEDNDAKDVDDEFRDKVKDALGEAAQSDAESIDMDDLDDEDMEKMDAALAKVFKELSGKKNWMELKRDKANAVASMHFKIRALDIIDVYLSHQPPMSHALHLVMPLIKAFEAASKQKNLGPLQERLRATLKKLSNLKKLNVDTELDKESVPELLKSLVDLANSGSPVIVHLSRQNLFGHTCNLIFKCGQQLESKEIDKQMLEIYIKSIDDFFFKGRCQLPMSFFSVPMQGTWSSSTKVAEKLISATFADNTRPYRKTQGLTLLTTLVRINNNDGGKSGEVNKNWVPIVESISGHVASDLETYMKTEVKKPRVLIELLHLVAVLQSAATGGGKGSKAKWEELVDNLRKMREFLPTNRLFREVKRIYNRTCTPLGIEAISSNDTKISSSSKKETSSEKAMKEPLQNGDGEEGDTETIKTESKKKRKKKSKESQQKRKEQKLNEYQGQLEDKEIPSFAGLVLNENLNFAPIKEEENSEKEVESPVAKKLSKKKKRKISGGVDDDEQQPSVPKASNGDGSERPKKKSKKKKVSAEDS